MGSNREAMGLVAQALHVFHQRLLVAQRRSQACIGLQWTRVCEQWGSGGVCRPGAPAAAHLPRLHKLHN